MEEILAKEPVLNAVPRKSAMKKPTQMQDGTNVSPRPTFQMKQPPSYQDAINSITAAAEMSQRQQQQQAIAALAAAVNAGVDRSSPKAGGDGIGTPR